MNEITPTPQPAVPNPEIQPGRQTQPEIYPLHSPSVPERGNQEFSPGTESPEVFPEPSPDATPPQREIEIAPLNDPIGPPHH